MMGTQHTIGATQRVGHYIDEGSASEHSVFECIAGRRAFVTIVFVSEDTHR